jgi:hypothetical protein
MMWRMKPGLPLLAVAFCPALAAVVASALPAQSYRDFMLVRNREQSLQSLLQFRLGLMGGVAEDEDKVNGNEDGYSAGGFIYYHQKRAMGGKWAVDGYAGRDGIYVGIKDEVFPGKQEQSRLEFFGRPFSFYREGYFDDGDFISTGRYEAKDYGARVAFGQELDHKLRAELGPFFHSYSFDRNNDTAADYTIPDDYNAYGARLTVEHNTLTMSRAHGLPEQGYLVTLAGEREQNDSSRKFGVVGGFESTLPSGLWRGEGHVEFYHTDAGGGTWEVTLDAQFTDEEDRVYNNDADKPNGNLWVDGVIGYRLSFQDSLFITPFGEVQFLRALDQDGGSSDNDTFFGGGVNIAYAFGNGVALVASYSYLNNPSRPPVKFDQDTFGEHQFFVGIDVGFAGLFQ